MSAQAGESREIQIETEEAGPVARLLKVVVAAPRVAKVFERAYREVGRGARVPGFRQGKVPRSVLRKMFGASLGEEVQRLLVAETLADAVELADLQPVSEPDIESDLPSEDAEFRYTARIEVKPSIELPSIEGLPAQKPLVEVEEADVDAELERLKDQHTPLVEEAEDVTAATGHVLTVDFVGRIDGETFEGGSARDATIELGAGRMIPGFEEQLVGARAGDDVEVRVRFPDDYGAEHLRSKDAVFSVHVASVRRREPPALDDEFAKDVGDFESLEALRMRIRSDLLEGRERQARETLHRTLLDALIERTLFEVPPGMVDRQLHQQMQSMQQRFQQMVPADVLQAQLARMHEEGRPAAERRVRERLLLEAVAEAEDVEVPDADVDARLDEMAEAQGMEAAALRKLAREQDFFDAVRIELRDERTLELLASKAKVEETAPT